MSFARLLVDVFVEKVVELIPHKSIYVLFLSGFNTSYLSDTDFFSNNKNSTLISETFSLMDLYIGDIFGEKYPFSLN